MLLTTKTTTIFIRISPNHQLRNKKHHFRNKNVKPPSRFSPLLSPSFNTNSCTIIPATLSPSSISNHQVNDCNADIKRFCEMSNLQKAVDLISKSEETIIDLKTYCDILQLCAESKALHHGKKVHYLIRSRGIELDSVLGPKLVFMYVSCGDLREGRRIFNNIVKENVFLWNFMMNAYTKMGDYEESICLFNMMQELGVEPDSYTFSCIFKCLGAIVNEILGQTIHGIVIKMGFGCDNIVVNSIIGMHFKLGRIDDARKLFDNLPDRDVITWNTMISGYVVNGLAEMGFEFFKQMLGAGTSVDLATMVSVVVACANIGAITLGRAVHAYAVKCKLDKEMKFNNTLLDMYSKCGDMEASLRVFEKMPEKSVVSWTSIISGYTSEGRSDKAIELFLDMKKEGVKPDNFTVTSILHSCASISSLQNGKEVHDYIKENQMQSLPVSNALMDMYAKCGSMDDSYSVFSEMPIKDIVSWNTMIGGYSKNGFPSEALDLFIKMQDDIKPDNVTITCILPACASLAAFNKGREIHSHVLRKGWSSDHYVVNALIDMYVKCGGLVLAKSLFDMTNMKNLVTWTIMISGYGMHGFGQKAVSTFKKMLDEGIKPDQASFTSILYACSHSGLAHEGQKFYNVMVNDYKMESKLEHYVCMVDLLSRAGKLSEAYEFIKKMPVRPDATIWGALLCGCRFHRDVKLSEKVAERIFELEPENTDYYMVLASIYAEADKWEEVKKLRDGIRPRGVRKDMGCSWIEIKGKVSIFVVGDKENSEAKKIESLLENLRMEMKKEGFSPKLKYALVDEDDIEKEAMVCGHSEMLAVGFGILKLPPGRTIRVTKNFKVCSHCHEMAKFISRKEGREIVLRDTNRFHHFKDGFCSCRGY